MSLTTDELAAIEARHFSLGYEAGDPGRCDWCGERWPCDTRRVLDAMRPVAEAVALAEAIGRLTETALSRFDQHGRWTGAMATIHQTYGGGWSVTLEYPQADYGDHLGSGDGDSLVEAVAAALADAESTIAAALASRDGASEPPFDKSLVSSDDLMDEADL